MITAAETCDFINEVVCKPSNVKELFEFGNFAGTQISRTEVLILLAAIIPVVVVFFGLRKKSVVPGKLQSAVESIFTFVKDEIALGVIGRGGEKFTPYLVSIFLFILVGNLFEVAPLINFPVTSRMALPLFLSLITYFIFVFVGIKEEGIWLYFSSSLASRSSSRSQTFSRHNRAGISIVSKTIQPCCSTFCKPCRRSRHAQFAISISIFFLSTTRWRRLHTL
jgi:F0F1-type ATP synthase membrane subunit a